MLSDAQLTANATHTMLMHGSGGSSVIAACTQNLGLCHMQTLPELPVRMQTRLTQEPGSQTRIIKNTQYNARTSPQLPTLSTAHKACMSVACNTAHYRTAQHSTGMHMHKLRNTFRRHGASVPPQQSCTKHVTPCMYHVLVPWHPFPVPGITLHAGGERSVALRYYGSRMSERGKWPAHQA